MSGEDVEGWYGHQATVTRFLGTTGTGTRAYDTPTTVACFASVKQRFIRGANGDQVESGATVTTSTDNVDLFAPESLVQVHLPGETRARTVITRQVLDGAGVVEGLDRVKVWLQ